MKISGRPPIIIGNDYAKRHQEWRWLGREGAREARGGFKAGRDPEAKARRDGGRGGTGWDGMGDLPTAVINVLASVRTSPSHVTLHSALR